MEKKQAYATTNQTKVINWTEQRDGKPAIVEGTGNANLDDGLLRIKFSNSENDDLRIISWEDFFEIFEKNSLEFLYQEDTKDGNQSRFFKFIERGNQE